MKIGKWTVGLNQPAYIIAEIGMNYNGQLELAKEHIAKAAECGVSAVKFQTFKAENLLLSNNERFATMKASELPFEWHKSLAEEAAEFGLDFLSTGFGFEELNFLDSICVPALKIASCDLNNIPLICHAVELGKPMIISTGYASMEEIDNSVALIKESKTPFVLLHCIASYPTEPHDMHLINIKLLQSRYQVLTGLSDHSINDTTIPAAARALGACVFEKHFTLDRKLKGFDHGMSADPEAMSEYVKSIRETEAALGVERRGAFESELARIERARRGLYWKRDLKPGDVVCHEDVLIVRPSSNLVPADLKRIVGKKIRSGVSRNNPVSLEEVSD